MERLFTFLLKLLNITKVKSKPKTTDQAPEALYTTPEGDNSGDIDMPKIHVNGEGIEVNWDKVETYETDDKWKIPEGNYKKVSSRRKVRSSYR